MWHKEKNTNPIIRLALLLALASTPMMTSLFKSDYVLGQSPETPSFELPTEVEEGTTIKVDGSASMTKANEALKQRFEKEYSGTNVEVATNGTDDALKALQEGNIDIAAIGRGLTQEEQKLGLEQQPLRREKIAIIVGKDNPFKGDLSNQRFTQIYRGQITNWSELGGPSKPIRVIDRPESSDTREAFKNYPLFDGNLNTGSTATKLDSDDPAEVIKELGDDGISFVLANQVEKLGDEVRVLSMHKVLPTDARYPYSQPLVYVFKQNPSQAVKDFVGFATAEPGQEALKAAREEEASSVAAAVAAVTSNAPDATATPGATPASTEAEEENATANNGAATENVSPATNTSASNSSGTGETLSRLPDGASLSAQAGEGTIPWWWILLPVSAIGALALWWLLGRRKSQEDDTVARGVLPENSPPPFTPTSTTTSPVKEPEPVVNTPVEPNAGINTAPVEPAPNTTSGINAAGIAAGAGIAGLGAAAMSSRNNQDTPESDVQQPDVADSGLNAQPTQLQQPDVADAGLDSIEATDLEQPDMDDTSLDLEAPAAVVNSSYHSLPRINTTVNHVETPPITEEVGDIDSVAEPTTASEPVQPSPQEELPSASANNNWLGNFAGGAGVAAAASTNLPDKIKSGAERIKSQFAGKDTPESTNESVEDESVEINRTVGYAQLPDVWDTTQTEQSNNPTQLDSSDSDSDTLEDTNVISPNDLWGTPETEQPITQEEETSYFGLIRNDNKSNVSVSGDNLDQPFKDTSHNDLWGTPETEEVNTQEDKTALISNNVEQPPQDTSPSSLWGTPETEEVFQVNTEDEEEEEEEKSSFPLGGVAAAGVGLVAGAAAIGAGLLNRDNADTSDDSNNTGENNDVEQQPTTENQENESDNGNLSSGWFLNRFRQNTPDATDDATDDNRASVTVETSELPEVSVTDENEQLASERATAPQEQPTTDGLPNVWATQSNQLSTTPEEKVDEQEVAQYGASSTLEDTASTDGGVLAGGAAEKVGAFTLSQMTSNEEESEQADAEPENLALDQIADQAEIDTEIRVPGQHSDPGDTDWDRIYGIHHNGATGVPGESNILLANRTPKWAYTSWNIAPGDREAMLIKGANQLVLRLYDVTNVDLSYQNAKIVQQYESEESVSHRYVAIPNADRDYITEIGYLTEDKEWLLVSRSPIIRVFSRPHKDFWFEADAELIIHGATEPGSTVNIDGQSIKVKQDGTFHLRVPFTESLINYLITAVAPDSEQAKTIHMQFSQTERKDS
ncbi:MAG: substrate-binding domain-containing protein [Rivularia sp. (in: cyanobacteria)]